MSRLRLQFTFGAFLFLALGFVAPVRGQTHEPKRLLLIGQGPDGHPAGSHEFMAGVRVMEKLLGSIKDLRITVAKADEPWPEGPALIDQADGIVMFVTQGAEWMQLDPKRHAALKRLAQRKGGIVALHWAVGAKDEKYIKGQLELLGGTRGGPQRKYKVTENDVAIADPYHPIMTGLSDFRINDEFYYRLDFAKPPARIHPLLKTRLDDNDETICWSWERPDGGRSFGYVGIHFHANWGRSEYRRMVLQAILWTLQLPIPNEGVKADIDPKVIELK